MKLDNKAEKLKHYFERQAPRSITDINGLIKGITCYWREGRSDLYKLTSMEDHVGKSIILEEKDDIAVTLLSNDNANPPDTIFAQTNGIFIKAEHGNNILTMQSYEMNTKEMRKHQTIIVFQKKK